MSGSPVRFGAPPPQDCNLCACGRVIVRAGADSCGTCAHTAAGAALRDRAARARAMLAQGMTVTEIAERLDVRVHDARRLLDPELGHVQHPVQRSVR